MVQTSWTSFDWLVLLAFASKVGRQRGMRSVPPRGSGWVQPVAFENLANSHADHQPTRYCVVVLTSCHVDDRLLRQSRVLTMENPPLQPLHLDSVLSQAKLNHYARLTTEELIRSLVPGQVGALKTRPDGTVIDDHHRIAVLRDRGVGVDQLPREVLTKSDTS